MADSTCPDNSTTCLLRALLNDNTSRLILDQLLEANNQYDWNPVTLGFTVAIGVLAFVVAVVTVFQGCLAAGPGRLKAGYQAIGPWYVHSDVSFSWYQLAARSRARTPFIDMRFLIGEASNPDTKKDAKPVSSYQRLRNQILFGFEESKLGSDICPYNASWANLLQQACITKTTEFGPLRTCQTDYVEESLRSAPASGMMKSLVFLATYVNDSSVIKSPQEPQDPQNRLYSVCGLSSDLISRDIETMGPAAGFLSFGTSKSLTLYKDQMVNNLKLPNSSDLVASYQLFDGKIPFGKTQLSLLSFENHDMFTITRRRLRGSITQLRASEGFFEMNACPIVIALCIGDVIRRPRAFPKKSTGLVKAIGALSECSIWRFALVRKWRNSFSDLACGVTGKDPSEQSKNWMYPARMREAPFLKLDALWRNEQMPASSSMGKREVHLARKLEDVSIQTSQPSKASWTSSPSPTKQWLHKSMKWEAKIEIASIVYALTRSIARKSEYDAEKDRALDSNSILEEVRRDRLATDRNRILVQHEIICVDEWLHEQEEDESNIVMCALMVLMKLVDKQDGLPVVENKGKAGGHRNKSRSPNPPKQIQVSLLSDEDCRKAMRSAFAYVGDEKETDGSSLGDEDERLVDDELVSISGKDRDSYGGKKKVDKTHSDHKIWNIVEILRYRALLYATMLELCADSSAFRGNYTDFAVKII